VAKMEVSKVNRYSRQNIINMLLSVLAYYVKTQRYMLQ